MLIAGWLALTSRGVAGQTVVAVLIAAAARHALVLGQIAVAVGAVLVLVAAADAAALHVDAVFVWTLVA